MFVQCTIFHSEKAEERTEEKLFLKKRKKEKKILTSKKKMLTENNNLGIIHRIQQMKCISNKNNNAQHVYSAGTCLRNGFVFCYLQSQKCRIHILQKEITYRWVEKVLGERNQKVWRRGRYIFLYWDIYI